jgi:hypothetical protein
MSLEDISSPLGVTIRPPAPAPRLSPALSSHNISTNPRHRIRIRHPQYLDENNILLDLLAPDHPNGGLHHATALTACGIIVGNNWEGWFTETKNGLKVELESDGLLLKSDYYFHLPSRSTVQDPYPVVPSFREWKFPHNRLPEPWKDRVQTTPSTRLYPASSLYPALLARDASCRISAHEEGTQAAHICPRSEEDWFDSNEMSIYNLNPQMTGVQSMDDVSNAMLLRADLHKSFDAQKFVFVPKPTRSVHGPSTPDITSEYLFVTHLLSPSHELGILYHNVPLQPIPDVGREFLFARFAWTIFPFLQSFLRRGVARYLLGATIDPSWQATLMQPLECRIFTQKAVKSRSQSPKKRTRDEPDVEDADTPLDLPSKRRKTLLAANHHRPSQIQDTGAGAGPTSELVEAQAEIFQPSDFPDREIQEDLRKLGNIFPLDLLTRNVSHSNDRLWDLSTMYPGYRRVQRIKEQWLRRERQVSDPKGTWAVETAWARQARASTLSASEAMRWYAAMGTDVIGGHSSNGDIFESTSCYEIAGPHSTCLSTPLATTQNGRDSVGYISEWAPIGTHGQSIVPPTSSASPVYNR